MYHVLSLANLRRFFVLWWPFAMIKNLFATDLLFSFALVRASSRGRTFLALSLIEVNPRARCVANNVLHLSHYDIKTHLTVTLQPFNKNDNKSNIKMTKHNFLL